MAINGYSDVLSEQAQKLVGGSSLVPPSIWWFALYATTPDSDGVNLSSEFTAASYARVQIYGADEASSPRWTLPGLVGTDFLVSNNQPVYFPTATEDWGTLNGVVIMNDQTANLAANMIFGSAVDLPVAVVTNMTVVFLQGAAKVTIRNL
jgi:hypothetical protein